MDEVISMLSKLQIVISMQSPSNALVAIKSMKEIAQNKSIQPKFTGLEFPKFNGDGLKEWLYKCDQYFECDETSNETKLE